MNFLQLFELGGAEEVFSAGAAGALCVFCASCNRFGTWACFPFLLTLWAARTYAWLCSCT